MPPLDRSQYVRAYNICKVRSHQFPFMVETVFFLQLLQDLLAEFSVHVAKQINGQFSPFQHLQDSALFLKKIQQGGEHLLQLTLFGRRQKKELRTQGSAELF